LYKNDAKCFVNALGQAVEPNGYRAIGKLEDLKELSHIYKLLDIEKWSELIGNIIDRYWALFDLFKEENLDGQMACVSRRMTLDLMKNPAVPKKHLPNIIRSVPTKWLHRSSIKLMDQ